MCERQSPFFSYVSKQQQQQQQHPEQIHLLFGSIIAECSMKKQRFKVEQPSEHEEDKCDKVMLSKFAHRSSDHS